MAERITWLGFVSGHDKANVLAAGDVYVQPSFSESFGMAAVEAVSAGLPCVLGENVAIAEELVAAGFAVAVPTTAEAVANGLKRAKLLEAKKSDYAASAKAFVSSEFSKESVGAELLTLYRKALTCVSRYRE